MSRIRGDWLVWSKLSRRELQRWGRTGHWGTRLGALGPPMNTCIMFGRVGLNARTAINSPPSMPSALNTGRSPDSMEECK